MTYADFLSAKAITAPPAGIDPPENTNPHLFDWQRDIVRYMWFL